MGVGVKCNRAGVGAAVTMGCVEAEWMPSGRDRVASDVDARVCRCASGLVTGRFAKRPYTVGQALAT